MPVKLIPVLVSATGEWDAIVSILQPSSLQQSLPGAHFQTELAGRPCLFFHSGWGKIATAASTQYVIDQYHPELILNIGTCGGFSGFSEVGEILLVQETLIYDIVERMDNPVAALNHYRTKNDISWITDLLPAGTRKARIISADQDIDYASFDLLTTTHQADAADWETGAFAWVAALNHIPWLALRGVSDIVTPQGSETDNGVDLWRSRLDQLMRKILAELPFYFMEFERNIDL
jgi:adenosylhomocysteine nucleosidase